MGDLLRRPVWSQKRYYRQVLRTLQKICSRATGVNGKNLLQTISGKKSTESKLYSEDLRRAVPPICS